MENQNKDIGFTQSTPVVSTAYDVVHPAPDENALEQATALAGPAEQEQFRPKRRFWRTTGAALSAFFVLLLLAGLFTYFVVNRQQTADKTPSLPNRFETMRIPLADLLAGKNLAVSGASQVKINGTLEVAGGLVVAPSVQPTGPKPGQIYYDQGLNQLAYYNGTGFVFLTAPTPQLAVVGITGLTAGSANVTIGNNGNGTLNISVEDQGGTGTVTSPGGTAGFIPLFTGEQSLGSSIISQTGLIATVNGDLDITGTLILGTALDVANGGTGATTLAANGVLVGQGSGAITSVTAGGAGLCLLSTLGPPVWGACPGGGGGGVTSLNGLTGALTLANASAAGSTITIDNASTVVKGIASFNATNFSVTGGAVNTIQDIHSGATPTFAGVNTNTITPSAAMTIGTAGQSLLLQGNAATMLTATNGGNVTTLNFQSPTASVTYRFLTTTAGTYDICTTAANCVGIGGGVTTPGGTTNRVAKFGSAQAITDSSITDNGTNVLTSSDVVIQGGDLTIGVPSTQTGTINLAHSGSAFLGSILQGALSANRTYALPDASGTFCLTSGNCAGGVTSLNGLVGALNIANASAAGSTITIDDASTSAKGIASFNSTNFSVSGGAVNTIQNIDTGATPTFAGVNTNNIAPSGPLTVGTAGQTALLRGSVTTITSSGAGNDIVLASADTIELQGGTNVTGNLDVSGTLAVGTADAFQVAASGNILTAGVATIQGGALTVGTTSQLGQLFLQDGSSNTGALQVAALGQNTVYTLPDPGVGTATICLTSGNCAGTGTGVTTPGGSVNRLAKFSGAQAISNSTITDDGTTVTTTVDLVIQGGDITVGTSSQLASLLLHDGNGQTTLLQAGDSSGNLTFILPTTAGGTNQCLKQSGVGNQLIWDACDGGGGGSTATLQAAYNNGNSITTTDNRDIDVVLADTTTDSNFDLVVADGSTGFVSISRANGVGTTDPAQLVLINNLDADRAVPVGIRLQAAGGGITTAIDASDAEIVDAINVAANNIVGTTGDINFTNFDVVGGTGDVTTAGNLAVNGGNITSSGGLTVTAAGGNVTLNAVGTIELQDNTNISGNLDVSGTLAVGSANAFQVATTGDITSAGNATLQGGTLNLGTLSQAGSVVLSDGSSNTGTLQVASLGSNRTYTLPDDSGTVCLSTGNCGGAAVTLQSAYNNSTSPELTLDATRGALTIRDSSGGLGANLLEVQNNAGGITYFGVTASGVSVSGTVASTGNINTSGGGLQTNGVTRIDNSGNATNIGNISLSGSISGGTTYSGSGNINTTGGALQTNSTTRVDNSGNLTNIGNITGTGAITIASTGAGNDIIINGADILDVQDAATFASSVGITGDLSANGNTTIGDTNADLLTIAAILQGGSPLVFEGAAADANELTVSIASLTGDQTITLPDETGTVCLRNSANCGFALSSGGTNYIQNQNSVDQPADFRISGTGQANTGLVTPSLDTATATALTIAGTNANIINVANNSAVHLVQIATSSAAGQTVTVGSTNASSTTTIQGGTGVNAVSIQGGTGGTISLGTTNSNTVTLGNATTTATMTLGQSTASNTINIGNATTATGNTQTINMGTSATGTGKATITIGNTNDSSALNLQAGTGNINLSTVNASGGTIVKSATSNSTVAFQVQNAANASLLTVDTSGSNISLLGNNSPSLATWTTTTAMSVGGNTARVRGGAIASNGYLYQIGGVDGTGTTLTTVQYAKLNADGTVGSWASTTALPAARKQFQPVVVNGYLYVIGGRNDTNVIQSTVYYAKLNVDGTVGSWSTATPLSTGAAARFSQGTVAYNGYIYVLGGFDSGVTSQSTAYYIKANPDGTLGSTWNTTTALPVGLSSINSSIVANGYVYVVGGFTTVYEDDIYYAKLNADGTVGSWTTMSGALNASGGGDENLLNFVANGYLYVVGGDLNDRVVAFQLGSTGGLDAGTILTDFPLNPVGEAGGASANGYFYVLGGSTAADGGGTARNTVYYTGGSRIRVGGGLDLVSYSGENLAEGGTGGQLTAGNTTIVGALQVQDAANFAQNASVNGSLRVGDRLYIGDSTSSTSAALNVTGSITVTGIQPASVSGTGTDPLDNILTGAKGGNTSGTTAQVAGTGTAWAINGGDGGNAPSGSTNGSGGAVVIQGGAAGSGAGTGNFRGNVVLQEPGGYVGIGTLSPSAILHIRGNDGLGSDLLRITDSSSVAADVFRVLDEGAVFSKNRTNSNTAFQIQNTSSFNVFTVDTAGSTLQIGSTTTDNTSFRLGLDSYNDIVDPPGFNGAMYYNTAMQQYRCYRAVNSTAADGAWDPCGLNPIDRGFVLEEEFFGSVAFVGWSPQESSIPTYTYNTGMVPTANHPGTFQIDTTATSGAGATFTPDFSATAGSVVIATGNVVKATAGLNSTLANTVFRVGLHSEMATNTRPVSGVWWEAAPTVNSRWQFCYGNGTTATCSTATNTTPTVATATWYRLEMRVTATGTNTSAADFFIDGQKFSVSGVTIDSTNRVNPAFSCFNSTAASRLCNMDYFQFRGTSSVAR